MPTFPFIRLHLVVAFVALTGFAVQAAEPSRHLAPGFKERPAASRILVAPSDIELFSISVGGIQEPRADWTEAAQRHFKAALTARPELGGDRIEVKEADLDEFAELVALHKAVAEAIWIHHTSGGPELPTKGGRLDWSLGPAVKPLRDKTGADYALFTWVRDTYASSERKAAMVAMLLLGSVMMPGNQAAYASLVDLRDGRVVWFNDLDRMFGDLREPQPAAETVESLLEGFPGAK